ncbi:hypothetical protein SCACP_34360 [Sporomusa carbonis]|uniref:Fe-only nitrogenase accessory AnfO family protein n=1 Tax=Sporomusa carbonis TaxID=3076075 RepID=UPI003A66552F
MTMAIAVHTGTKGESTVISDPGMIRIFRKRQGMWHIEREQAFQLVQDKGLREMRRQMAGLIEYLGECKVFVASTVTGVPYYELEKAGLSVWEYKGKPVEFLDYILEKEEEAAEQDTKTPAAVVIPTPEHLGNGFYKISIKEIQESESGITTKQVLMPFLRRGSYYQLEVLCNHVPPWLEAEAMTGNLCYESEKIAPGEVRLILRKQVCDEKL